jgi:hypothetical protein
VVLAAHFFQAVSHGVQKILIRRKDFAVKRERDDGLRPADRRHLPFEVL